MLEFSDKKVVGTVEVPLSLTENDIENIMVTAIEGGIGYWACLNNVGKDWDKKPKGEPVSTWATKLLLEGKTLRFVDEEEAKEVYLTLDSLVEGYRLNYIKRPWDNSIENGDVTTADCIVQFAVFGEVLYG